MRLIGEEGISGVRVRLIATLRQDSCISEWILKKTYDNSHRHSFHSLLLFIKLLSINFCLLFRLCTKHRLGFEDICAEAWDCFLRMFVMHFFSILSCPKFNEYAVWVIGPWKRGVSIAYQIFKIQHITYQNFGWVNIEISLLTISYRNFINTNHAYQNFEKTPISHIGIMVFQGHVTQSFIL